MRLWFVYHVVYPSMRLLYTNGSPFLFCHELVFRNNFGYFRCNLNMSIFVFVIVVFFRIENVF